MDVADAFRWGDFFFFLKKTRTGRRTASRVELQSTKSWYDRRSFTTMPPFLPFLSVRLLHCVLCALAWSSTRQSYRREQSMRASVHAWLNHDASTIFIFCGWWWLLIGRQAGSIDMVLTGTTALVYQSLFSNSNILVCHFDFTLFF